MKKTIIPTSAVELEEMLQNDQIIKDVMVDPDSRAEFLRKYAIASMQKDGSLKAQINEQLQMAMAEQFAANDKRVPRAALGADGRPQLSVDGTAMIARGRGAVYNKFSPGAALETTYKDDDRFTSIGEYCQAIREEARPSSLKNRADLLRKLENVRSFQNSFGSEDPGAGGFLIPELMRSELLQLALEQAIVRPRATVIPMSTLRVPVPTVDDTSHVSSLFGGVTFYWAEESASITESQAQFGRIVLDAKKLTGFFKVPNELLADAPAFSGWFDTRIPQGLAWAEDVAFIGETGAGTPEGFVGSPAYVKVTRTGTFNWANLTSMYARMLPASLPNAVWIAAIDTFPTLAQLTLSTPGIWMGGYGAPPAASAPPVSIMGRPVIFTEKTPAAAGTSGDLSFVDLSYYLIGDRQAVAVSSSEHFAFQNDQTAYRIIERVDGRPWLQQALTPHNGSTNTLSAYVGLN